MPANKYEGYDKIRNNTILQATIMSCFGKDKPLGAKNHWMKVLGIKGHSQSNNLYHLLFAPKMYLYNGDTRQPSL